MMHEHKIDNGNIRFVSSQDSRTITELIEYMTILSEYQGHILLHFSDARDQLKCLLFQGVRYVAMLTRYYHSVFEYLEIIRFVHEVNPEVKIVIGGGFFLSALNKLNNREQQALLELLQADFYICHDTCQTVFPHILKARGNFHILNQIPRIIWRSPENKKYISSLGKVANEHWDPLFLKWEPYMSLIPEITSLKTTIACPFSCAFCAVKNKTEPFQLLPLESIRHNIQSLLSIQRTKIINFTDETINFPPNRFRKMLKMLIELNSGFKWYSFFKCEYIDRETIQLMKKSGCIAVLLGMESGNDQLLKRMNKRVTAKQLIETHRLYQEQGIITIGFFVIGFPGETEQSLEDTVRFIEYCHPDFYRLHPWECDTSAQIWKIRQKVGLRLKNGIWSHNTMNLRQAKAHINKMQNRIRNSVSIDKADFSFALQMVDHGVSLEKVKKLYIHINTKIREGSFG